MFGSLVRRRRDELGLTPLELAKLISLDKSSVSRIETGATGPPSDETIKAIADALELDYLALLHAAGRGLDRNSFEERVLATLDQILAEQRSGFERLDAALAELSRD